jgi:hypothetical protein
MVQDGKSLSSFESGAFILDGMSWFDILLMYHRH